MRRFRPHRESLAATLVRTITIAIVVASVATLVRLRHLPASPAECYGWLVFVVFAVWISFGGHWVELAWLNGVRPRIARWPDPSLVLVRLGVWLIGGALLFSGAVISRRLMTAGGLPGRSQILGAVLLGGPLFALIELVVHAVLLLSGKPSFWNLRG